MLDATECLSLAEAAKDAERAIGASGDELERVRLFQHHLVLAMGTRGLISEEAAAQATAMAQLFGEG